MLSQEITTRWLDYFEGQGHTVVPSAARLDARADAPPVLDGTAAPGAAGAAAEPTDPSTEREGKHR